MLQDQAMRAVRADARLGHAPVWAELNQETLQEELRTVTRSYDGVLKCCPTRAFDVLCRAQLYAVLSCPPFDDRSDFVLPDYGDAAAKRFAEALQLRIKFPSDVGNESTCESTCRRALPYGDLGQRGYGPFVLNLADCCSSHRLTRDVLQTVPKCLLQIVVTKNP